MRKLVSYIAMSLDGKIAKPDGDTMWLHNLPNPQNLDYGYEDFMKSIDTTLMGNKTHEIIAGFAGEFPYGEKKNFVFTRNKNLVKDKNIQYVSDDLVDFIRKLKKEEVKNIWLIGGGVLNAQCINNQLIDELIVFVMPIVLGEGICLFSNDTSTSELNLVDSYTYPTGVVRLTYKIKEDE